MKRLLYTTAILIGLAGAAALGQQIVQQALTGSEAVLVQGGGPGGPGAFTNVTALRDAHNYALIALVPPSLRPYQRTSARLSYRCNHYPEPISAIRTFRWTNRPRIVRWRDSLNGSGQRTIPCVHAAYKSSPADPTWSVTNTVPFSMSAMWTYTTTPSVWQRIQ